MLQAGAETAVQSESSKLPAPEQAGVVTDSETMLPPAADRPVAERTEVAESTASDTSGRAPEPRTGHINMRFTRASWVAIRDRDGKAVFAETGSAGSERNIEAVPPLSVVIGNAAGVRMTYNGEPLDVASRAERNIARFTLE